ncbi:PAS domain S-box protein [Methanolobus sp. WCC5]|uniref:sensor histidine kinase n=1 Tax=Methanolobus sp. WCC5 TaxID=3125785 RepID=UPI00324D3BA7
MKEYVKNNGFYLETMADVVDGVLDQPSADDAVKVMTDRIRSLFCELQKTENVAVRMSCLGSSWSDPSWTGQGTVLADDLIVKGEKRGVIEIKIDTDQIHGHENHEIRLRQISRLVAIVLGKWEEMSKLKYNEKRVKNYCNKLDDHIFVLDADGNILDFNNGFKDCTGYSTEELAKMNINDLISNIPEEFELSGIMEQALSAGHVTFEVEHRCKNGEIIPLSIRCRPLEEKPGCEEETALICVARDISREKITESKLQESENMYSTIVEEGNDGIIIIQDGKLTFVNSKIYDITGFSPEEVLNKSCLVLMPAYEHGKFMEWIRNAGTCPAEKLICRVDLITKSNREIPVEMNVSLIEHEGREARLLIIRDVSERKHSEELLKKERDRLENYLDVVGSIIGIVDRDSRIIFVNKRGAEVLGYPKEDIIGKNWFDDFLPQSVRNMTREAFFRVMAKELDPPQYFENLLLTKSGEERLIFWHDVPLEDENGERIGMISSGEDITERKKAEEKLKRYAEELQEANELKDLFTDIIRHDLLTPASVIKGYTEELLLAVKDEQARMLAEKVSESNDRLIEMLETATKLAKLQKEEDIVFEKMDIVPVFRMVTDSFRTQLEKKKHEVVFSGMESCICVVNPVIEEVFANLLSNAIKYSPSKTKIGITFSDDNDMWKVSIADNGIGIPDQDKPLLFDRFHRADKKGIKGTGLGLAIVKRIIELHSGHFGVTDNPQGQGSVFWVAVRKG